jgi:putative NADH-flavin reductase
LQQLTFVDGTIAFRDGCDERSFDWTFVSPPPGIGPGPHTGKYRVGKDECWWV